MLHAQDNGILFAVIAFTAIILLLLMLLIMFVLVQQKKKLTHKNEIDLLHARYSRTLLETQLEIQEQTLSNISQEIHDNIGQVLSLAKLQLATIDLSNSAALEGKVQDAKQLVGKAIQDLRNLSHGMNTDFINDLGLCKALENELDIIGKSGLYQTNMKVEGPIRRFDKQKELILFRIVQEVLNNTLKHAKASAIEISIQYLAEEARITITDDGQGFDTSGGYAPQAGNS